MNTGFPLGREDRNSTDFVEDAAKTLLNIQERTISHLWF
jgi:hypothetical protein